MYLNSTSSEHNYDVTVANSLGTDEMKDVPEFLELKVAKFLELYVSGFLVIIGIFGNAMSLVVLTRGRMRNTTLAVYLSGVAASDLAVMIIGQLLRHWIRNLTGVDLTSLTSWYCSLWMFLVNWCTCESSFLLAGVGAERCLAIMSPLRSRHIICKKGAYIYTAIVTVLNTAYNAHNFLSYYVLDDGTRALCTINKSYHFVTHIRVWTDFMALFAVPACIIAISNIIIIFCVVKAKIKRDAWLTDSSKDDSNKTRSTIAMLVAVCMMYIVLLSPLRISYFVGAVFAAGLKADTPAEARQRMAWSFSILGYYINHSVNFYVYVVSGREFRAEVKRMLCFRENANTSFNSSASVISTVSGKTN